MIHTIDYSLTVDGNAIEVTEIGFSDGYKTPVAKLSFQTDDAGVSWLGKEVVCSLTNESNTREIFTGYVEDVNHSRFPEVFEVSCGNILLKARNHWIIQDNIESFWERSNIAAYTLIHDLLAEAGITDYSGDVLGFTFGTSSPVQFNLLAVMDAIDQINNILATTIYMDGSTVRWAQIFPTPSGSPVLTLTEFINISKTVQTRNLRNKVVVFGKDGIHAEASVSSPYLPDGFYQSAIVSSELIDSQSMADASVDYNLELYNKLGQELRIDIEGNPSLKVMDTVHVTHAPLGLDEDWFVYSVAHNYGEVFTTTAMLRI